MRTRPGEDLFERRSAKVNIDVPCFRMRLTGWIWYFTDTVFAEAFCALVGIDGVAPASKNAALNGLVRAKWMKKEADVLELQ